MSFLRMQESPNFLIIRRFRDKPGMTSNEKIGLLIQLRLNCRIKNYLGVFTPSDERNTDFRNLKDFGNLSSKIKSVCIRLDQWLNITTQSVLKGVPTKIVGTRGVNALKGQNNIAQGIALSYLTVFTEALKGRHE